MIDKREPDNIKALKFGMEPMITLLDHGDVIAFTDDDEIIAIERKTTDDLLNSLRDERLIPQVAGLLSISNKWSYLVVCGELRRGPDGKAISEGRATGWNYRAVQGALLTIQEMGVRIAQCGRDAADFEAEVVALANRQHAGVLNILPPSPPMMVGPQETLLCSIRGIGVERAQSLIQDYGSAYLALEYLTKYQANGMPRNVCGNARDALGLEKPISLLGEEIG